MKLRNRFLACALALLPGLRAELVAPSPAITPFRIAADPPRHAAPAAAGTQYLIGDPTDEEQFYLELLNRTRADPTAEGVRLATTQDPDILRAYEAFGVDLARMQAELAALPPAPPLAFAPQLTAVARSHTRWMLDHGIQAHEETDPPGSTDPADIVNTTASRLQTSGYPIFSGGESVFAFSKSVEYGHAGFEVDWGFGPGGVQIGVGHRVNNHEPAFREIGIGVLHGARTVVVNGATNTVGPQLVTFDFGTRFDNPALVTGVAYYDLNANQLYDVGEGIGGLTVEVSDSASFAVTAGSGGYAVPTANGSRSVTFSGPGLTVAPKAINVAGGANLKLDLRLAYAPPVLTGPAAAFLGGPNAYSFAPVPGATSYVWESARRLPFTSVLGAETGLGDLTVAVTPGYPVITAESRRSGAASYHLVTPTQDLQSLTLNARLRALTGRSGSIVVSISSSASVSCNITQLLTNISSLNKKRFRDSL